ncbi:MAG: biotin--[acetyl-CoA-carboxylase] ligase [Spirochaetia bacterium]|jgi:BirA family biotin operon repressor/biotin-[acetyl-CoA-carboxylase] ligase|nr:biotin--[acetyl-CoA-carboxylase] ligase [Spirochaetia bacterium]
MDKYDQIMKLLVAQGPGFISGEEIAGRIGRTRAYVWKGIAALRENGAVIEAKTNKGYRLVRTSSRLSQEGLAALLPGQEIHYLLSIDSTNRLCKQLAAAGKPEGTVVAATFQTQGRGRLGRSFSSPEGGVYFSLLLRPHCGIEDSLLVTSAAAVAVERTVSRLCGKQCAIKWVNDVYLHGKKICGILCEGVFDLENSSMAAIVAGIGINFAIPQKDFPPEVRKVAVSLYEDEAEAPAGVGRNELVAGVVKELLDLWHALPDRSFLDEYRACSNVIGKKIFMTYQGKKNSGIATGIDENAHLLVTLDDGSEISIGSGEVSLRFDTASADAMV